jgi:kumamolisin
MRFLTIARSLALIVLTVGLAAAPRGAAARGLGGPGKFHSLSPHLKDAVDLGRAPASERHRVVVSLDVRDREGLEAFLADVQDPSSPRYRQFLSQADFDALYAPTPAQEEAVVDHLRGAGLRVTERFPNRLLVGAAGNVAALERAFGVEMHSVQWAGRRHYAALDEPSLPAEMASYVVGVIGLDDLSERHPHVGSVEPAAAPRAALGSNCCHLSPNDVFAFYDNTAAASGAGETIVIAGAYAWRDTDNTAFNSQWGLPQLPAGSAQVCTGPSTSAGCKFSSQNSIEIALDVEYAHGTAPAARVLNYMSASTSTADFTTMYNRIVTDNPGHVVSTSWGACEVALSAASQQTDDNIFANANAIGQSWFAASGDSGSRDCSNILGVDNPANSPHMIGVGGTRPACSSGLTSSSPACGGYGSESAWSGSGGGVSQVFARPAFQSGCGVPAGTRRLVPDVALEADTSPGNYVAENGSWWIVGGTSDAAPQWAGLAAALAQQSGGPLGNPGALLYGLCGTAALHDVTSGSNGDYSAGVGYDLVTGLGSFDARNLLAAAGPTSTTTTSTSTTTTTTRPTTTLPGTTTTTLATTTTTTTVSTTTTATTASPTTTTTVPATTTTTTTSTSSTTTTLPACFPSGATCTANADCCSKSCRKKGPRTVCK